MREATPTFHREADLEEAIDLDPERWAMINHVRLHMTWEGLFTHGEWQCGASLKQLMGSVPFEDGTMMDAFVKQVGSGTFSYVVFEMVSVKVVFFDGRETILRAMDEFRVMEVMRG